MFDIVVIGGGTSGTLAAIQSSSYHPNKRIALFERRKQLLSDIPGNSKESVMLTSSRKKLLKELVNSQVDVFRSSAVESIRFASEKSDSSPSIQIKTRRAVYQTQHVIIACGQDADFLKLLMDYGLTIRPFQPAAFQLLSEDPRLKDLRVNDLVVALSWVKSGRPRKQIQIQLASTLPEIQALKKVEDSMAIRSGILSGQAVHELSLYIARQSNPIPKHIKIGINWLPEYGFQGILEYMQLVASTEAEKTVSRTRVFNLPSMLWSRLVAAADIEQGVRWKDLLPIQFQELATQLSDSQFVVKPDLRDSRIAVYTGGVQPENLRPERPECRDFPGIYLLGSILDNDSDEDMRPRYSDGDLSWIQQIVFDS